MSSNTLRVTSITKDGATYPIMVSGAGKFYVEFDDGETVVEDTLEKCREKALRRIKARNSGKRIEITVQETSWRQRTEGLILRPALLTGWHARNRSALIRYEDGRKEAATAEQRECLRRLTVDEAAEMHRLYAAKLAAEKAYTDYVEERRVNPLNLLGKLKEDDE